MRVPGCHTATVIVEDKCKNCAEFDLDFSPAAFSQLAPESKGRSNLLRIKADPGQNRSYMEIHVLTFISLAGI